MMEKINDTDINRVVASLKIEKRRRGYFIILALVIFVSLSLWSWIKYFSPQARSLESWQRYSAWEKQYKDQLAADKYGGQTPQETINLFADALRKGDVDLASKYFVRNTDGSIKPEVIDVLKKAKTNENLSYLSDALNKSKYDEYASNDNFAFFSSGNSDGDNIISVELRLDSYSKVWKIESF